MQTTPISIKLDVAQGGVQNTIHVQQGEANSRTLVISLRSGFSPLPLDAADYVVLRAITPDGSHILNDCYVEESAAHCTLSQQMLASAGTVQCELSVYGADEQILYSPHFSLEVAASPLFGDDYVEASDEFTALETAMHGYLNAQSQVDAAEATCTAAEGERAVAETARTAAEQIRQASEAERITAEVIRADAELNRNNEESDRVTAEATRVLVEALRVSAEESRAAAEAARADAETTRVSAEGSRGTAETSREAAETTRATAETERNAAEQGRVSGELSRAGGESERQAAEQLRVTAEGDRATAFQSAQDNRNTAYTAAENARDAAFLSAQVDRTADYTAAELMRETACTAAISDAEDAADAASAAALACAPHDTHERRIQTLEAMHNGAHVYGVKWDGVQAQCTRLFDAEGITTDVTHFCHRGSIDPDYSNPFDSIYPWSEIKLCNISIDAYRALTAGTSIRACVTAWLGDPDFDWNHANGVWRYCPEFWYKAWEETGGRCYAVSQTALDGYIHAEEAIEGRWYGGVYALSIDGTTKSCLLPKPGMPGKRIAMSTLHAYANNWGASIEDIYLYDANTALMIVEYATMNISNAIGNGVTHPYRQSSDLIKEAAVSTATVKVLKSAAANCIAGAILDIGTENGGAQVGSFIVVSKADDPEDSTLSIITLKNTDGAAASITVTTANFWSIHGIINLGDVGIGSRSGYIGVNGRSNAYYRGQVSHANLWRYCLGAYRQTQTRGIWIASNREEADAYHTLDTSVHMNTGLILPTASGYIQTLGACSALPAAPFCTAIGGNGANPVGDYSYVPPLAIGDTILRVGGCTQDGGNSGRFCCHWWAGAGNYEWSLAAIPVLKGH